MIDRTKSDVPPAQFIRLHDLSAKLEGIIVIHLTTRGPSVGGCRLWRYSTIDDAFLDAIRLAEGMSFKNAMAGLPFGGAKAVIRKPEGAFDRSALFEAFGEAVDSLGGSYITAADVGTSSADMDIIARKTPHVLGRPGSEGRAGGDPSPWTALGVFHAMQAACRRTLSTELDGRTVAVQGLGHVGADLCRQLAAAGARLVVADINRDRSEAIAREFDARIADPADIALIDADIFAPCALGQVVSRQVATSMKAKLVCGAANNQLTSSDVAEILRQRGIIYVPDYVANAGGIISAAAEHLSDDETQVVARVVGIGLRVGIILEEAAKSRVSPLIVADRIAGLIMNGAHDEYI